MKILAVLLGGYVTTGMLLYLWQDRLLYHPTAPLLMTPAQHERSYEDVYLETVDGETLHGWWIPGEPNRGVLLFLHGNAGNISGRIEAMEPFLRLGLNVFVFDYRGYGRSTGTPSEEGLYRDAEAAWSYLTDARGMPPNRIILFGRSLGGGVATWLAGQTTPAALILEATFTSVPDVAQKQFPFLPVRWLARARFDNLERIGALHLPTLIIHSPDDDVIPFEHGQRLYEEASAPKSFLEIEGLHHNGFSVTGYRYGEGIDNFLEQYVEQEMPRAGHS